MALKVIRDAGYGYWRREMRLVTQCSDHPSVVSVFAVSDDCQLGHQPWIAMEYCDGGSFTNMVKVRGGFRNLLMISDLSFSFSP